MICIYDGAEWIQVDEDPSAPLVQIAFDAIRNLEARVAELESR